jgi:hypothetical protein
MGTPKAHNRIQPTFPFSSLKIFIVPSIVAALIRLRVMAGLTEICLVFPTTTPN